MKYSAKYNITNMMFLGHLLLKTVMFWNSLSGWYNAVSSSKNNTIYLFTVPWLEPLQVFYLPDKSADSNKILLLTCNLPFKSD